MNFKLAAKELAKLFVGLTAIAFFVTSLGLSVAADSSYPKPTKNFFVNDFANVIENGDESKIQADGVQLYEKTKAQVVVVTVPNMGGKDIESYSIGLAREWGIGDKEKNSGVLLLLALEERKVRIEVGTGLEGALNDAKTGRIIDTYGMEHLREDNFSKGLAAIYNSIVNEVYIEYGKEPEEGYEPVGEDDLAFSDIFRLIIIITVIIGCFIVNVKLAKNRGGGGRGGRGGPPPFIFFGGPGGFGGGRGGFGGGFGGGGFSGGGGGFSGGGSSRGF